MSNFEASTAYFGGQITLEMSVLYVIVTDFATFWDFTTSLAKWKDNFAYDAFDALDKVVAAFKMKWEVFSPHFIINNPIFKAVFNTYIKKDKSDMFKRLDNMLNDLTSVNVIVIWLPGPTSAVGEMKKNISNWSRVIPLTSRMKDLGWTA